MWLFNILLLLPLLVAGILLLLQLWLAMILAVVVDAVGWDLAVVTIVAWILHLLLMLLDGILLLFFSKIHAGVVYVIG